MRTAMRNPPAPPISRRSLLRRSALGFGTLGLYSLLSQHDQASAADGSSHARRPQFPPRAKRVIFMFMHGGVSHVDSFDPKPRLTRDNGKPIPFKRELSFADENLGGLRQSSWSFRRYGQSGIPVSDLFPHVASCADDLCIVRSMVGEGIDHGAAMLQLHTGTFSFTRPSIGSWVVYGLGSENENLPGFITIKPTLWQGGDKNWSSSFLPGQTQGVPLGTSTSSIDRLQKNPIENLIGRPPPAQQQYELEMLRTINARHQRLRGRDTNLEARIHSLELAFRMQVRAPEAFAVDGESKRVHELYGLDDKVTRDFGWQCLLARRLAERGVRFIQCTHSGKEEKWDHHRGIVAGHSDSAREVDKPIAGLLKDLKHRGLLDDTLVIWGGEFGRTPYSEADGRDHNPYGFTIWMAGGGVKPGFVYGATDEFGYQAVEGRMHVHDLHATILHLLGIDHESLTYHYSGRDFRLTDVHGNVAHKILA